MLWHWTLDYKPYLTIHSFSALKVLINLTKACLWTVGRSKSTKRKFKKAGKTGKLYAEGHQLGFELGNVFLWDYNTLPTMTVDWLTKLCSVKIRCHSLSKTLATFVSKKAIFFGRTGNKSGPNFDHVLLTIQPQYSALPARNLYVTMFSIFMHLLTSYSQRTLSSIILTY